MKWLMPGFTVITVRIKIANQEIVTPYIAIALIPFPTWSQIESLSAKAFMGTYFVSAADSMCSKHAWNVLSDHRMMPFLCMIQKHTGNILHFRYVKTNNDADQNQNSVLKSQIKRNQGSHVKTDFHLLIYFALIHYAIPTGRQGRKWSTK